MQAEGLVRRQDVEPGRAGAVADERPGSDGGRGGVCDLAVGHAQQHDVGARAVMATAERPGGAQGAGQGAAQTAAPPRWRSSLAFDFGSSPWGAGHVVLWTKPSAWRNGTPQVADFAGQRDRRAFYAQDVPPSKEERREALKAVYHDARSCTKCPQLAATRTTVVFGSGNADADLMFVGEAPGKNEDEQGLPFVGQAGKLLDKLLGEIGLARADVFIANVLKCLRYNALVQLGDGSWERIGRLVRTGYAGTVMSVDARGQLVPRKVTGWHATPLGERRVFRLTYRSAKRAGSARTCIELTGDHPVLTERGLRACRCASCRRSHRDRARSERPRA